VRICLGIWRDAPDPSDIAFINGIVGTFYLKVIEVGVVFGKADDLIHVTKLVFMRL